MPSASLKRRLANNTYQNNASKRGTVSKSLKKGEADDTYIGPIVLGFIFTVLLLTAIYHSYKALTGQNRLSMPPPSDDYAYDDFAYDDSMDYVDVDIPDGIA